ncbi:MAG: IS110 family transposase [Gammaproteobacteria bacterium]|nr:MAG: IS110 family transposase [Gammaproteobacteria bacterium]
MSNNSTTFVGLDVHKDSITVACVGAATTDPVIDVGSIGTQQYAIDRLLKRLGGHGRLELVYEAGPCGFWLQRYLASRQQACVVVASSLIPQRPGDRIKTDRRDARNLALALRAGTLTPVHIPTPAQEAFRDVVRAWQQAKRDITAARQRLKSFLLRNDIRYTGQANWSAAHRRWLAQLVLPSRAQQIVCQELIDAISERERRRDRIEAELDRLAPAWDGYPLAHALQAFRGIQKTVAYTVIAEAGDLSRFAHPRHFMAWLGLVPGEHSSGATRRQGPITRCGNRWARTLLVEAAWAYRYSPKVSAIIERRAQTIDPQIRALAWKAQLRLSTRYRRLAARGKHHNVVVTAIARELGAFIWAAARLVTHTAA